MSNTDYQFDIEVATRFLDDQSVPEEGRYVFAYTVHIRNDGKVPARLLGRRWLITDGNGKEQEVVGEGVVGHTWVAEQAKGAKFDRHILFAGADGRKHVSAVTTWALLDRATGRPLRVPQTLVARFAQPAG